MIIVTSAPPNSENSIEAIKSWHKYGKVYSLNSVKEIDKMKGYDNVTFIPTHRIMEWNNRPLVSINAMIDLAIEKDEDLLLINGDIIIDTLPEFKHDGITILTRCDYESAGTFEQGILYEHGFDAWFIPKHFLKVYPPTIYCLGFCFFDYSIPYRYLVNSIPVYWPQGKCIYHKTHPFAWNFDEWKSAGIFFKWEFKIEEYIGLEQMAMNILSEIKQRTIK